MTGYEEQLYAQAEMLEETGDLADDVAAIYSGAAAAGVDPCAVTRIAEAIRELDPATAVPAYDAGRASDRHPGKGFASDAEFLEALAEAEEDILTRRAHVHVLQREVTAAAEAAAGDLDRSQQELQRARSDLAAAYAMATREPCNGCHGAREAAIIAAQAAIDQAEAAVGDARHRISLCEDTTEKLGVLSAHLTGAIELLHNVPHDLGEVYELIYAFIQSGGKMPRLGRWIEGAPA